MYARIYGVSPSAMARVIRAANANSGGPRRCRDFRRKLNICADMPFRSANPPAPDIRGAQRTALVRDLALGELTHQQLAERYGRQPSAISSNFSSRNKDEINAVKQEMSGEDIEPWGTQKRDRLAMYSQQLVEVDDRLQSGQLTPGQEVRFRSLLVKTLHQMAEEMGELPTRAALELDLKNNPFAGYDAVTIDDAGNLHPVRK